MAELVKKVNTSADELLKYIPTEFFSEEQIQGKIRGLRKDVTKYPDSPYDDELEQLEKRNGNVKLLVE